MRIFLLSLVLAGSLCTPLFALAQSEPTTDINIINPLNTNDPREFIGRIIQAGISISGAVALVMFIYAGILFLTAMGKPEPTTKAKQLMIYTTLGILIIASAFVLTNTVFKAILTGDPVGNSAGDGVDSAP